MKSNKEHRRRKTENGAKAITGGGTPFGTNVGVTPLQKCGPQQAAPTTSKTFKNEEVPETSDMRFETLMQYPG